jgi:hypothetical protein
MLNPVSRRVSVSGLNILCATSVFVCNVVVAQSYSPCTEQEQQAINQWDSMLMSGHPSAEAYGVQIASQLSPLCAYAAIQAVASKAASGGYQNYPSPPPYYGPNYYPQLPVDPYGEESGTLGPHGGWDSRGVYVPD